MGKCLICRHDGEPLLKSTSDSDNDDPDGNQTHRYWATTCINSLCTLIKIPQFQYLFLNASYCEVCLQLLRDIDFSLQQINNFQKQILGFRDHLFTKFGENYKVAVVDGAVGTTEQLSFDDKVKFVYKKINDGSKGWTGRDFMHRNPPKSHQINVLKVLKIENNDENESMKCHSHEKKEEFIPSSRPQDIYKEKAKVYKDIVVVKEEPEQDIDLNEDNDPDWRCLDAESAVEQSRVHVPEIVFGPQNVLDDLKTDCDYNEPMEFPKDEKNTKYNDSRLQRKRNEFSNKRTEEVIKDIAGVTKEKLSGEDESKGISQYMDMNEDIDPDWESSDAESVEDHFTLRPSKKRARIYIKGVKECNKQFLCKVPKCGRGFDLESGLLVHQLKVHEGDSTPHHCKLCDEKFKRDYLLLLHISRVHSMKCNFCGLEFNTQEEQNEHENVHKNSDNPFKCTITNCDQVFTNSTALKRHMLTHDDNKIKCDVCGKHFKLVKTLTQHQKIHDDSYVGFPCTVCNKICANPNALAQHMDIHSDEKKYICDVCGATFKLQATLSMHKRRHSEAKLICQICGKGFRTAQNLKTHEETHSGTLPSECKICGKKFAGQYHLKSHEKTHDPNKKKIKKYHYYDCEVCNKTYRSTSNFSAHQKIHKKTSISCLECNKEFKWEKNLKIHMDRVHSSMKCSFCGMNFKTKDQLDEHENSHKNNDKPFTCTICDEVFTNSAILKQHMLTHDEGRPSCDVCGKTFETLKYRQRHRKMHDESFIGFPCTICNKKLLSPYALAQHMEIHSDEKKYICDVCGEAFKQNCSLRLHKRTHDGDLKFVCQICGKGFTSSSLLTHHEEIHSGTLSYECKICKKKFRARKNLFQHEKTHESKDPNKTKRIRPNRTTLSSQAKKVKAAGNRISLKYADSSSSKCESEEDSHYSIENEAKKTNQDHVQEQQAQTPQYPSTSTQRFQPVFYNMRHSNFQYPNQ